MYFLISAALLVNAAFAANIHSKGGLGLSSVGFDSTSGLSGLSGISGLSSYSGLSGVSGLSGLSVSSDAPLVSEVSVGGAANQGLVLGGAANEGFVLGGAANPGLVGNAAGISSGEVVIGGGVAAPALSGASFVGEQVIGGGIAAPALSGAAVVGEQVIGGGAVSTGFAPMGVTTYTAQAPTVKNIYRDSSHVHPAKEVVYKIRTPPKVHKKVVKIQQVVKQPKINVLEVLQSPKIQKLSILEKPAKQIVKVMPTKHTATKIVVKAPEAPMTQKVFYSEKAREANGNIVSYEKHNIRPAQVSQLSAGARGGVYVSHSGPTYSGGQTYTGGFAGGDHTTTGLGAVEGQTLNVGAIGGQTLGVGAVPGSTLDLGAVGGQPLDLGAVGGQTLNLGAVSGSTLDLGAVGGQPLDLGAVGGQTLNLGAVGGQTFETTLGADNTALNLGAIGGGLELGTGALNVNAGAGNSETALNLGSAVGGGNVKTWVEKNAGGFTHHKVVKGGDLATWNAEFGSSTFGAGHDLNPAWKK